LSAVRDFADACVDQSPASGELPCVELALNGEESPHVVETIGQGVVVGIDDPVLVSWQLQVVSVISSQAVNVAGEGAKPAAEEGAAARSDQLIHHAEVVRVQITQLLLEVVEEDEIVMLPHRVEEGLVAFVRSNVDRATFHQFGLGYLHDLGCVESGDCVLEVASSDMEAVKLAGGTGCFGIAFGSFPNGFDHTGCCALDLIDITHVVADESFLPVVGSIGEQKLID